MDQYWLMYEANRKAQLFELELKRARWQQQIHRSPSLSKQHFARLLTALRYVRSQFRSLLTGKNDTLVRIVRSDPARTNS